MNRSILLPLDGTRAAETALHWGKATALASGAAMRLLTVIPEGDGNGHKKQARKYLQHQEHVLRDQGVAVSWDIVHGEPGDEILRQATEHDLTVMTSGTVRWLISAVLDRVLQGMSRPLVVVRANSEMPSNGAAASILVPVDTASYSVEILPPVRDMAVSIGASITLCHVIPPIGRYVTTESAPPGIARIMKGMIEESRELMAEAAGKLYQYGIRVKTVTAFGEPVEAIVREAESSGAGLIAMATRGRDRLHKRIEGSVAQTVIERARVPCLLVRPAPHGGD